MFYYDGFDNIVVLFIFGDRRVDGCWYNGVVVFKYYLVDFFRFFVFYIWSVVDSSLLWVYNVKYFFVVGFFLYCFYFVLLFCVCFVLLVESFFVWMGGKSDVYVIGVVCN